MLYGVPGGAWGVPGGSLGASGDLFGGPEPISRSRVATLEGPGGALGVSKNGPRVFFSDPWRPNTHIYEGLNMPTL